MILQRECFVLNQGEMEREEEVIAKVRWCDEAEENVARVRCRNWKINAQSRTEWRKFIEEVRSGPTQGRSTNGGRRRWRRCRPRHVLALLVPRASPDSGEATDWTSLLGSRQILLIFRAFKPVLGPLIPTALYEWIKRPGHDADLSPPCSAEVRSAWLCTSTLPYAFMACH